MSIESAQAFLERMKTDASFAKKVATCKDNAARMTLVKAAGFDFTAEEFKGLRAELSDVELQRVAGGASRGCGPTGPGEYTVH